MITRHTILRIKPFVLSGILVVYLLGLGSCGVQKASNEYASVAKTRWIYTDNKKSYEIYFKLNGQLITTNKADVTPYNDGWKQDGNTLFFHFNDGYAKYKGTFKTDNLIEGTAVNKVKKSWKWTLKRKYSAA